MKGHVAGRAEAPEHVSPTLDDPVAAALSPSVGGPLGEHAGRHPWWSPVRVVLAVCALVFAAGMVQHAPCYDTGWSDGQVRYADMCYSDLPYLYVDRGFAELNWPYSDDAQVRARYTVMEYPVGISYYAWGTAWLTHWLSGSPDLSDRYDLSLSDLFGYDGVPRENKLYISINTVGFAVCALLAAWFLSRAHRRRPWDAMLFAASPVLLFDSMVNWDLLAVVCVAGALWSWSRGRPVLTGALIGLGTAVKLYPLFLLGGLVVICVRERRLARLGAAVLAASTTWVVVNAPALLTGPDQWKVFWTFNRTRGADLGSVWLAVQQMTQTTIEHSTINTWSWVFFGCWCVGVLALGLLARETPRLAQLGLLVVAGFLLVNKVYSPQYALWLLPLAVLARPRWRDLLIWQAAEVFYFASVWWYLGEYLEPAGGGDAGFYWIAIGVRMAGELYLVAVVVRDVLWPHHDPVRLDEEPVGQEISTRSNAVAV